jgi:hypothetical protein
LKLIGGARSEKADISLFNELVQLLRGVKPGAQTDDTVDGVLKLIDSIFSADCEFCEGKLGMAN